MVVTSTFPNRYTKISRVRAPLFRLSFQRPDEPVSGFIHLIKLLQPQDFGTRETSLDNILPFWARGVHDLLWSKKGRCRRKKPECSVSGAARCIWIVVIL